MMELADVVDSKSIELITRVSSSLAAGTTLKNVQGVRTIKQARMVGNYVYQKAIEKNCSIEDLCDVVECNKQQFQSFIKGRLLLSFPKLQKLADFLEINLQDLINGDKEIYDRTVVNYVNGFSNTEHREEVLDIIDNYIDIFNSVN